MREYSYEYPYGPPRESPRQFSYDKQGRLTAAGSCHFTWTDSGSLRTTQRNGKTTQYHYGDDTRLDTVLLPTGAKITYQYAKGLLPVGISRNGLPVMEFSWKNTLLLTRYMDRISSILYVFSYDNDALKQVTFSGPEAVVSRLTGQPGAHLKLNISVDQLGSIRRLETPDGVVVKTVEYDSFGNVMQDSRKELYFPLGFAGGLFDPFTGFTRFGFRDYDPNVGRFTAKDPLGDTGGDHDLYDYCVDDPVSCVDPEGLWYRVIAKGIGRSIGGLGLMDLAFPPKLNDYKGPLTIEKEDLEKKVQNKTATEEEKKRLQELNESMK